MALIAAAPALGPLAPAPVSAAPRSSTAPVIVVTDVGDGAQGMMPAALWHALALDAVHARNTTIEAGTSLPDAAQCRAAHAAFAVLATFDRSMRLPGLAQDPDRAYAIARITVRNCATGEVETKTVRIESDPISPYERLDLEANAERIWNRAVRTAFARDPVVLDAHAPRTVAAPRASASPQPAASPGSEPSPAASATPVVGASTPPAAATVASVVTGRVVAVAEGGVLISGSYAIAQHVRAVAAGDPAARDGIELVVVSLDGRYARAISASAAVPQVGDVILASSPAPHP